MPASKTSEPHTGRVALMTGAAHGIGQDNATGLAKRRTRIVLGDIDEASETSYLIGATGHPAVPVTPDVSDPSSIEAARDRVTDPRGASPRSRGAGTGLCGGLAGPCLRETPSKARAISPEVCPPDLACRRLARVRWTGSAHGGDGRRADSGLGEFHADMAGDKSFCPDVLGWETGGQPIGAFTSTMMRSADAGDEQRSERHHAAQPEMTAAQATPRWASRSPTAMLRQPPGRQSSILSRASLVTRFGPLGSAAAGKFEQPGEAEEMRW
jgi:NAD(P)-dependent dehydrogenase (short-subunit alcohol dehydrogenase family)